MRQPIYGLLLFIFLILPPVATILESIMIIHMHMQMPMLVASGFLMAPFFQRKFPRFFKNWNSNGVPGILLFVIIMMYWMLPRAMDEALTIQTIEIFKFISLPFLAGVPLRDSWKKLGELGKNIIFIFFTIIFFLMGWLYVFSEEQICNNYLKIEQVTLGWGFVLMGFCLIIYLIQVIFMDQSEYK